MGNWVGHPADGKRGVTQFHRGERNVLIDAIDAKFVRFGSYNDE